MIKGFPNIKAFSPKRSKVLDNIYYTQIWKLTSPLKKLYNYKINYINSKQWFISWNI